MSRTVDWPEAEITALRAAWRAGHTASDVAVQLNAQFKNERSRNSIIGKARRLGLANRGPARAVIQRADGFVPVQKLKPKRKTKTTKPTAPKPAQKEGATHPTPDQPARRWITGKPLEPIPDEAAALPSHVECEPHTAPVTVMMRRPHQCAWPVTAGLPHLFCGAPRDPDNKSYCEFHARLSVQSRRLRQLRIPEEV